MAKREGRPPQLPPVPQQPLDGTARAWLRRALESAPGDATRDQLVRRLVQLTAVALGALLVGPALTSVLPGQAFAIATDSMEPAIGEGSLVFVEEQTLEIGDVIAYRAPTGDIQVHRLVSITQQDGETRYVTQGDANQGKDSYLVPPEEVVGVVHTDVPLIGYPWTLSHAQAGALLAAFVSLYLGIALWDARSLIRPRLPDPLSLLAGGLALVLLVPTAVAGVALILPPSGTTAGVADPSPLFLDEGDAGSATIDATNASATATATADALDTRYDRDHVLETHTPATCAFDYTLETSTPSNLGRLNQLDVSLRAGSSTPSVPADLPTAREGASAVATDDGIYVFGGYDGTNALDDIVHYDPDTGTVSPMDASLPTGRQSMSAVWNGTHVLLFGGVQGALGGTPTDEILSYDPSTDTLSTMSASLPSPRYSASAVWDGTHAYVFGGYDSSDLYSEILRYDPAADSPPTKVADLPTPRLGTGAVWNGSHAFVFGGQDADTALDEIVRFEPGAASLDTLAATLPSTIVRFGVQWTGTEAYVYGGETSFGGTPLDTIVRFVPEAETVTTREATLPTDRRGAAVAADGDRVYVAGGNDGSYLTDIVEHNASRSVLGLEPVGLPEAASGAAIEWNGTHAFVFGGFDGSSAKDTIQRVDPDAQTTTTMSATLPPGRQAMSSVWTGQYVFLFGGVEGEVLSGSQTAEILRYDPSTDTLDTMDASLPSSRYVTTAVWNGTHAFVFGGYDHETSTLYSEILRYDPAADSPPTKVADLTSPRAGMSGVWDGTHAFVFGGHDGGQAVDVIERFDPSDGSTTTLSSSLPEARLRTSAVFDGSVAYVFGGEQSFGGTKLAEIVQFDPSDGSVTTQGATLPSARDSAAAAWTGSQALVTGGKTSEDTLAEIVTFDPGEDIASPMARIVDRATTMSLSAGEVLEHTLGIDAASTGSSTIDTRLQGTCGSTGITTEQSITYAFE